MAPTTRSKRKRQQAELERELRQCAAYDDLDRARELVEIERVNVNCFDEYGWTPLINTAWCGSVQVARLLLENRADVDAASVHGWTALVFAVVNGRVVVAEFLLEYDANVDNFFCQFQHEFSLLGFAIYKRNVGMVRLLLRFGANTEETLYYGKTYTALCIACWNNSLEVVQLLLDHDDGVDVNAFFPIQGAVMSPLCLALYRRNNMGMARLLVQHGARGIFDGVYPDVPSPLRHAVVNRSLELVCFLLDHSRFSANNENARLQPERIDNHPLSPALESALCQGKLDVAQLLVDRGANVNDRAYGFLWKLCAKRVYRRPLESARLLLRASVNVNLDEPESGETPLWAAASNGRAFVVQELLKARADVRIRDNNGETPLGVAYRKGHKGVVYLLLRTSPHVWCKLEKVLVG